MHEKREENALVIGPDERIYAIGGFNGKKSLSSVERYDPYTGHWETIASLKTPRRSLCAVATPDGIYAIGGHNAGQGISSIERFDEKKLEWVHVTNMMKPKYAMAAVCSIDDKCIYILGGYTKTEDNTVERFDIVENKWEKIESMRCARIMHSAVMCG